MWDQPFCDGVHLCGFPLCGTYVLVVMDDGGFPLCLVVVVVIDGLGGENMFILPSCPFPPFVST